METLENIQIDWRTALMFVICLPMAVVGLMLVTRNVERRTPRLDQEQCLGSRVGFRIQLKIHLQPRVPRNDRTDAGSVSKITGLA